MGAVLSNTKKVLLTDKQFLILLNCNKKGAYVSKVAKNCDITYTHVLLILKLFIKKDVVQVKRNGRKKYLSLTKKGKEVLEAYITCYNYLR